MFVTRVRGQKSSQQRQNNCLGSGAKKTRNKKHNNSRTAVQPYSYTAVQLNDRTGVRPYSRTSVQSITFEVQA